MTHPTALAYILPATPLPRTPHRPTAAHSRRPRAPSAAPVPCVCRRTPTSLADGGSGGDNDKDTDNASARPKAWDGFKVWFSRRDAAEADTETDSDSGSDAEAGSDGRPVVRNAAPDLQPPGEDSPSTPPPRRGPPPQVTVIPDVAPSVQSDSQKADGFRWPWIRTEQGSTASTSQPLTPPPQPSSSTSPPQSSIPPKQPQQTKARVTHSDTKPGSMLEADPSAKADPGLQDRWKKVIGIIVPNKAAHPRAKKGPDASSSAPSSDTEASANADVANPTPSRRRRGIMELYLPPSEPGEEADASEKKQQPWFGIPWKRDAPEMTTGSTESNGKGGEDSDRVSNSSPGTGIQGKRSKKPSWGEISRSERVGEALPSQEKAKTWFTPPWAKQNHKDSSENIRGSRDGEDIVQRRATNGVNRNRTRPDAQTDKAPGSESREFGGDETDKPEQKGWFRWPGSRENRGDGEELPTIETSARDANDDDDDNDKKNGEPDVKGQIVELGRNNIEADESSGSETPSPEKSTEKECEPVLAASSVSSVPQQTGKGSPADMVSIPQRDVAAIRLIFGSETFFATEALSAPGGLIFRGNLRGEPKATLTKLEQRLKSRLGDKYTLCLAEGEEDLRPVVVVVPTARDRRASTPRQKAMAVMVGMMTVSTCLGRGTAMNLLRPRIAANYGTPLMKTVVDKVLYIPIMSSLAVAVAIAVLILSSQVVQRAVAGRYRTRIAIPYVLPSYQLGSFGAVVQLASPTPTRAALFDIAMSGAMMLVVPSVICLVIGLRLSTQFPTVVPVPMSVVSNSMLMGALTRFVPNGQILMDYARSLIGLHPLAVIGANCLTIAAFNLLPMRQLDGGRIISALYGRKTAVHASRVTVLFLLLATSKNPSLIVYLLAVMLGPWHVDRPAKNELTEPDALRTLLGYTMMVLMIAILLPYPRSAFFGTL